jgi:hypothetical protein
VALALLVVKNILFVALFALLAQWLVGIFNWGRRQQNLIWQLFALIAKPFTVLVRKVTPRQVLDQHIPLATFLALLFMLVFVSTSHREVCLKDLRQTGCERYAEAVPERAMPEVKK